MKLRLTFGRWVQAIDIEVPAGRKVALVGGSGSGKSSVLMLVMRFYDPTSGQVLIDGQDIRDVNVKWLRQQIGFVSQVPDSRTSARPPHNMDSAFARAVSC